MCVKGNEMSPKGAIFERIECGKEHEHVKQGKKNAPRHGGRESVTLTLNPVNPKTYSAALSPALMRAISVTN